MDDAQYDECDDEYISEGIEYTISPEKSSLSLIQNVEDFTDRNKIFSTMFMASPKAKYRSEFTPRKFAVMNPEIVTQTTIDPTFSASDNEPEKSILIDKSDKLSVNSKARHVPSSRASRLANFSSLGIGLGLGAVVEASRRVVGLGNQVESSSSVILSEVITIT